MYVLVFMFMHAGYLFFTDIHVINTCSYWWSSFKFTFDYNCWLSVNNLWGRVLCNQSYKLMSTFKPKKTSSHHFMNLHPPLQIYFCIEFEITPGSICGGVYWETNQIASSLAPYFTTSCYFNLCCRIYMSIADFILVFAF